MDSVETSWPQLVPQRIRTWEGWPDDVRPVLLRWNKTKGLSFRYGWSYGKRTPKINGIPYFICDDCDRFIRNDAGADRCEYEGKSYCEDCLIALARLELLCGPNWRDDD